MDQFTIKINGEEWSVRWSRSVRSGGRDCWGLCYLDKKLIRLHKDLKLPKNKRLLCDTLTHEIMHAIDPELAEHKVRRRGTDIAKALHHPALRGYL